VLLKHGCLSRLPCNTISYLFQHRYYGESFSFGSEDQAFQNACALGYLSSEQALADYAQLITNIKKNPSAENCPVMVGVSQTSRLTLKQCWILTNLFLIIFLVLASWFRLKYPHVTIGALASSAPQMHTMLWWPEIFR